MIARVSARIGIIGSGLVVAAAMLAAQAPQTPQATAVVTVTNPLAIARPAETIELSVADLRKAMTFDDVRRIHVRDDRGGKDLLTQAVDLDDNGTFELVVFQADLAASERRTFTLSLGERHIATAAEYRAYGRFVRERRDDFVWENDLVAHRMYGAALETWPLEPLTSSAVDVWVKRTPKLVANDWYMTDDYHADHGDGADLYSAGNTRGCGGNGVWANGTLYPSANFRGSRVLANGPIRVLFELTYDAWDAGGQKLSEVKRIQLDAGHRLNRFESTYRAPAPRALQQGAGIRKNAGADIAVKKEIGVLRTWEAFKDNMGSLGCAVLVDPRDLVDAPEGNGSQLLVTRVAAGAPAVYYTGSAWDRGGNITTPALWDAYLASWADRLRTPVVVTWTAR
jgi:hypothetical protein